MNQMKKIRITTLADNVAYGPSPEVLGEHGLSLFVEIDQHKILFDTGSGSTIISNTKEIGLDLPSIESIVISHGHGDHMGGLADVLKVTGPKPVYVGSSAFHPKGILKANGDISFRPLMSREEYEALGACFYERNEHQMLFDDIWLVGPIPRIYPCDDIRLHLRYCKTGAGNIPDPFSDEQVLAINTCEGLVLVVGCTHNGLENTVETAMNVTGASKLHTLIGGLHLMGASSKRLETVCHYLRTLGIQNLVSCHCTGQKEIALMFGYLGDVCRFNHVGSHLEINI